MWTTGHINHGQTDSEIVSFLELSLQSTIIKLNKLPHWIYILIILIKCNNRQKKCNNCFIFYFFIINQVQFSIPLLLFHTWHFDILLYIYLCIVFLFKYFLFYLVFFMPRAYLYIYLLYLSLKKCTKVALQFCCMLYKDNKGYSILFHNN